MKNKIIEILNFKKIWVYIIIVAVISGTVLSVLLVSNNKNSSKNYKENSRIENKDNKNKKEEKSKTEEKEKQNNELKEENAKKEKQTSNKKLEETSEKESKSQNKNTEKSANTKSEEKITTKIIEEIESIPFSKSAENEINMLRGTTKLVKNGINGTKTIKYRVSYNSNNKEISREVISETITKQPVNEITKVGISDYNLNTDTYGIRNGYICSSGELDNLEACGYSGKMYCAIVLNNTMYLTNVVTGNIDCLNGLSNSGRVTGNIKMQQGSPVGTVAYNGQSLYFDVRAGADSMTLTQEVCNKNNLACGRW